MTLSLQILNSPLRFWFAANLGSCPPPDLQNNHNLRSKRAVLGRRTGRYFCPCWDGWGGQFSPPDVQNNHTFRNKRTELGRRTGRYICPWWLRWGVAYMCGGKLMLPLPCCTVYSELLCRGVLYSCLVYMLHRLFSHCFLRFYPRCSILPACSLYLKGWQEWKDLGLRKRRAWFF